MRRNPQSPRRKGATSYANCNGAVACDVAREFNQDNNMTDELNPTPLEDALALVDFGPCRSAERPQDWMIVASPMCAHCVGTENVDQAAARIIAEAYRKTLAVVESIEERYVDGCDTYEDWKFMGVTARNHLWPQ